MGIVAGASFIARLFAREKEVLFAFVASRLIVWVFAWGAWSWLTPGEFERSEGAAFWDLLFRWDAHWYANIAQNSYSYTPGAESSVAFFPLLPALVALASRLTGAQVALAGFLVSNLALLLCTVLLRRLLALDHPEPSRVPARAVWVLLFCPMTFFHSAFYTESLFLLLSVAAVLCARQGRWAGAGLTGALLTATRSNGILILAPLLCEAATRPALVSPIRTEPTPPAHSRWWLVLVPTGLLGFMTYLYLRFGDALAFAHAQAAWGRAFAAPWDGFRYALDYTVPYRELVMAVSVVAPLLCLLGNWMRLRLGYQLYAAVFVIACLCSTQYYSLPRYLSVVFPFYLALARAGQLSEGAYLLALSLSAGLMALCLALFVSGYFMV